MILKKQFDAPRWNVGEIMRYARIRGADESYRPLINECMSEAEPALSYRVCYTLAPLTRRGDMLCFCGMEISSDTVRKAVRDAEQILLFAATVGAPFDLLIRKYSAVSPSKALMMQAIGAERVESLCDAFCADIDSQLCRDGLHLTPRVSPGYGDIPLDMQRDIFAVLDCPRKIGLTLDESLMMSPSKSVTALCGVVSSADKTKNNKCSGCGKTDCAYRTGE